MFGGPPTADTNSGDGVIHAARLSADNALANELRNDRYRECLRIWQDGRLWPRGVFRKLLREEPFSVACESPRLASTLWVSPQYFHANGFIRHCFAPMVNRVKLL